MDWASRVGRSARGRGGAAFAGDIHSSQRFTQNYVEAYHPYDASMGSTSLGVVIDVAGKQTVFLVDDTPGLSRNMVLDPKGDDLVRWAEVVAGTDLNFRSIHASGAEN